MLDFKIFVNRKDKIADPLEDLLDYVSKGFKKNELSYDVFDINDKKARDEAEKIGLEEVPALLFKKIRISGQLNEYFLLAVIAQLLTATGDDQKSSDFAIPGENQVNMKSASEILMYQSKMREDISSFLLLIRESPDDIDPAKIKAAVEKGAVVFILANFENAKSAKKVATLGNNPNILIGHIIRSNMHMTLSITLRKNRPFFGSFLRAKFVDDKWVGKWSPLLHDTVSELRKFYIPLFSTASPVHLDGSIPQPRETNRVVAKVKDNIERIKTMFY